MWKRFLFGLVAPSVLVLSSCSGNPDEDVLRVGMIPDAGASQLSVREKEPLRAYLAEALERRIELIIPTSYNATVEAIGNGSLDIAYLGGLTYVKAHEMYGAVPLVQRDIDQQFHSLFIAAPGSGIDELADLHGKTFCFGDINSTSGHLMPRAMLREAGIDPEADFASIRYTGSHPATALAVATGACDSGALDETVFRSLTDEGRLSAGDVAPFQTSEPFADYVWAARDDVPADDREAFTEALLKLRPDAHREVLEILRADKYVPASHASYQEVAEIARELGLL